MNEKNKYIHYGSKKFNIELFDEIKNVTAFTKPAGGLWACMINAKFGWKNWCELSGFRECKKENSFQFKLKNDTKILKITNANQLYELPNINPSWLKTFICLDFETIKKDYDVIEVFISRDEKLYWKLYGWDCDSLLVMNPNCVEVVKNE